MGCGVAGARTLAVGADKEFKQPSDAIGAARPGDTVQIQPGEYFDCATVRTGGITIEGVGDPAKVLLTDKACGGKGLLVIDGDKVTVRNLTLTRARVPDGNGAGIRNEAANLTVDGVRFVNNQNGILSTPAEGGTLLIKNSLFDRNGYCGNSGGCAHGIYVDRATLVRIENSTFTGTKQGHHIKSRAPRTEVVGCTIQDGEEGDGELRDRHLERRQPGGDRQYDREGSAGGEPRVGDRDRGRGCDPADAGDHDHQQQLPQRRRVADGVRAEPDGDGRDADGQTRSAGT